MPGFSISNSFIDTFDAVFLEAFYKQNGSVLQQYCTPQPMVGDTLYVRMYDVGEAKWRTEAGQKTEYTPVTYDKRKLKPEMMDLPIMLDEMDGIRQATPPIQQIAQSAASACGRLLDAMIIQKLIGPVMTEFNGEVTVPLDQIIAFDFISLGDESTRTVSNSLCPGKLLAGKGKMNSRYNTNGITICVAPQMALSSLRAGDRAANRDFNIQPAVATGVMTPFAGVDIFVPYEDCPWGLSKSDGTAVQYAVLFNTNTIRLASTMPLRLKYGTDASRYLNDVLIYSGMFDAVRMYESGVVLMETKPIVV